MGVGPFADHIPEHVPTSFASVKSSTVTDEDGAGAHDVWYFFAVDELLKTGQIHVLEDLLRNSRESEVSTVDHTSSVFT